MTLLQARQDKLLTQVSQKRVAHGCVAEQVLTYTPVKQSTGLIGKYGTENLRIDFDLVGGEAKYPRISATSKSSDRYVIEKHGLSQIVTEEDFLNEEQPFDARSDATEDVTDKLMLGKEFGLASQLTDTSVITQNVTLSGTDRYNDYANSDPLGDFATARAAVKDGSGQIVNGPDGFAIVPWEVYNVLCYHPALLDLMKHTTNVKDGLSYDDLRSAMKVGRILVPECEYDSSKEGQTANIVPIWGKNIIFGYAPKTGKKKIKTLGFRVQQNNPRRVFVKVPDNPPNAELILVDDSYDMLLTDVGAAYLIEDAIA